MYKIRNRPKYKRQLVKRLNKTVEHARDKTFDDELVIFIWELSVVPSATQVVLEMRNGWEKRVENVGGIEQKSMKQYKIPLIAYGFD